MLHKGESPAGCSAWPTRSRLDANASAAQPGVFSANGRAASQACTHDGQSPTVRDLSRELRADVVEKIGSENVKIAVVVRRNQFAGLLVND